MYVQFFGGSEAITGNTFAFRRLWLNGVSIWLFSGNAFFFSETPADKKVPFLK